MHTCSLWYDNAPFPRAIVTWSASNSPSRKASPIAQWSTPQADLPVPGCPHKTSQYTQPTKRAWSSGVTQSILLSSLWIGRTSRWADIYSYNSKKFPRIEAFKRGGRLQHLGLKTQLAYRKYTQTHCMCGTGNIWNTSYVGNEHAMVWERQKKLRLISMQPPNSKLVYNLDNSAVRTKGNKNNRWNEFKCQKKTKQNPNESLQQTGNTPPIIRVAAVHVHLSPAFCSFPLYEPWMDSTKCPTHALWKCT